MNIRDAIKAVIDGVHLSFEQTAEVFEHIMSGGATDAQIAAFVVALRLKGETVDEIAAAASVMRQKASHVIPQNPAFLVDTCGTGGDVSNTFNISTTAAIIAAGAGARVAKHGNRSVSSQSGSADVLEALGITIGVSPGIMKQCLDEIGLCFLFAPTMHKAMKYAIGPRREIGIRTIFNILGPLTNPSLAPNQLLGVFNPALTETMAQVLQRMGSSHAFVVHGTDGLDEISLCAPTSVAELFEGSVRSYTITPEQFGLARASRESILGGSAEHNATIIMDILGGQRGAPRDAAVLNAGFALVAAGCAQTPQDGIAQAQHAIDSGRALDTLEGLKKMTAAA